MREVTFCNQTYRDALYLAQLKLETLAEQGQEDEAASGFEYSSGMAVHFRLLHLYRSIRDLAKAIAEA
jgi:hypothetical protein